MGLDNGIHDLGNRCRLWPMPASKRETKPIQAKTFEAVLERTVDRLRWVIARIPIDLVQIWGKRGQIKVQGEINGFAFARHSFSLTVRAITFSSSTRKCYR